jgi:type I restriction-modification system DNA methylase subunit
MLREMRDAAGDSGEFYTPRPVVRFMVQVTDPRLGETVLDPAAEAELATLNAILAKPPFAPSGRIDAEATP